MTAKNITGLLKRDGILKQLDDEIVKIRGEALQKVFTVSTLIFYKYSCNKIF